MTQIMLLGVHLRKSLKMLIQGQKYGPLPYDSNRQLVPTNIGALVKTGDTLYLRSGLHGDVFVSNHHNDLNINIIVEAGHTPILKALRMQSCSNWIFDGITVSSELYGSYINSRLVYFETHSYKRPRKKMSLFNSHIYSGSSPWAVAEDWVNNASSGIYVT